MRKQLTTLILAAAVAGVCNLGFIPAVMGAPATQPTPAAAVAADVPVKEVVLFSSGVGYFEHFGTVRGDGSTELRFKTNQINDILKSLVLQDLDGGKVAAVTYPSQDPIAKTLKSFQVDITTNPPLSELLNQLRGAKVTVAVNGDKTTGVILGVERKRVTVKGEKSDEQTAWAPVLNLVSNGKIISQAMDPISSIELDDPALQDELNKALVALAGARDQDKKPVKISFTGNGDRRVRLGYVVETPIWKTSYRLILGDAKRDEAKNPSTTQPVFADGNLQGWAIIENQTDNDWNNVQLSLISGRPISFVEDLYQPLYIPRPVVTPELFASLRPQTYAGGMEKSRDEMPAEASAGMPRPMAAARQMLTRAGSKNAPEAISKMAVTDAMDAASTAFAVPAPMNMTASVASVASASSVGELFQYTVGSVSLPRQRSAMIPIITDPIEVERVSIYNQNVLVKNPLNGARVKNTTKKHLLAGPITVIDGATYAGDAQIDNLPPGQERLLSYGVDLQMLVDAANNKTANDLQTGRIVKGVLYLTHKLVQTQIYAAENKSDHDKVLIVEHPRQAGWDLVDTQKEIEKTDNVYRFRLQVPMGRTSKLTVKQQVVQDETMAILPVDFGTLDYYRQQGAIPKSVKEALAKAIELKQAQVETQRQLVENQNRLSSISAEQNRIRENLRTVAANSQYYTRLMTKLNDQETQIEKTQGAVDDLMKKADLERQDLENYLQNLDVN